jgi:GTP-binding protein HflX
MIKGNIEGIKEHTLSNLEELYNMKLEKDEFINAEILEILADISYKINREINITIDRRGNIIDISIGDSKSAQIPAIDINEGRLSGVRTFHTHPNGISRLSNVDISALIKLKLDSVAAIGLGENGKINDITVGFCTVDNNTIGYEMSRPMSIEKTVNFDYLKKISEIEKLLEKNGVTTENDREYAVLIGIDTEKSLDELEELAKACDVSVVGRFLQKRTKTDNVTFIGSGKAQELFMFKQIKGANLIIFDDELTGIQVKNLEEITNCKVIDRTVLILEIFARRATSREGKIQVELAQLKYRSTKLLGYGISMSRTGGGVGTRGLGETKLEMDRRRIRDNIHDLKEELEKIRKARSIQREKREQSGIPKIALVGYTNAGKSTLRNLLVRMYPTNIGAKNEDVLAKNMLFATLDVTTRMIMLPSKQILSVTDTVGFIRKLPHDLIEAFKSTLDEVSYADVIVHVLDGSSDEIVEEIIAVENVLLELNALDKPTILAINKIDTMETEKLLQIKEKFSKYTIIEISAKHNINIDSLIENVTKIIPQATRREKYIIPYNDTAIVAYLHRNSIVENEHYGDSGVEIESIVNDEVFNKMIKYKVNL